MAKKIYVREDIYRRVRDMIIRYSFQSPQETIEFLLDLAEETPYLERKVRAWKRKRGLI